jgi:UDP-N-acetylglucosamine--N-acetylmuramyl-(pentapeptide) pyrophosphoryl-undecaprenol N-acetylglucosamine transferase
MRNPVYIICGGTGGHLAPGIATAQRFLEEKIPVELIISEKEVDSRLLQAYPDIPYKRAKGAPFGWKPGRLIRFLYGSTFGFIQGFSLLRRTKPTAVIAFGGYLSAGFVISAWILKVPVILHEANRKPGRSIRSLAGMADRIYLPDGVHLRGIEPRRIRHLNMPLRREVHHIVKEEIRNRLSIPMHVKVLTVVGGSQGAEALNKWVERHRASLAADGIWVFLVAGPGKQVLPELETYVSDMGSRIEVRSYAFHNALHELFSASDVVVGRAGAGSMAELVTCVTPSILIPYPYAADQHQLANARDLERRGGAILVEQSQLKGLYREVLDLIYNDWLLGRMRNNLKRLIHGDAAMEICQFVIRTYINGPDKRAAAEEVNGKGAVEHDVA